MDAMTVTDKSITLADAILIAFIILVAFVLFTVIYTWVESGRRK